ncbi:MAG: YlbF family regulator [Akkermansiaceae bacterium]
MNMFSKESNVLAKTRELCDAIAQDIEFVTLQGQVERFLADDDAKLQYQSLHERGEELHHKQHAGVELSDKEIQDFEDARDSLMANEIASDFMAAQQSLQTLQKTISQYVGMTLELGRVPTPEDVEHANGGGCCGGGCGC